MSLVRPQLVVLAVWLVGASVWLAAPRGGDVASCNLTFPGGMRLDAGSLPAGFNEVSFTVRNDGDQIVRVKEVSGSCTCMDIVFPGDQLAPGESKRCTVKLNVQPGGSQTGAVFLQTSAPVAERYAFFIAYRGIQEDRLELSKTLHLERLEPEQQLEFELECYWECAEEIAPDALVDWRIEEPKGITLLSHHELREGLKALRSVARLRADAHGVSTVEARVEVTVGAPTRARAARRITVPVMPSLTLEPEVVLVTKREELERELLARVQVGNAGGWTVDGIESPSWLRAEFAEQQLLLMPTGIPQEMRGVYEVRLASRNAEGLRSERAVRIVLDMEKEQ